MKKICSLLLVCFFCGAFFVSCGLEDIITVYEPTGHDAPTYSSEDESLFYFQFTTAEARNSSLASFNGTDVYYKIYNNSSTLDSERNNIINLNESTNSLAAATRMIDSQGYNYQQLKKSAKDTNNFISKQSSNTKVYFRLKSMKGMENKTHDEDESLWNFRSCINFGDKFLTNSNDTDYIIPMRYDNKHFFDFFDEDENDKDRVRDIEPVEGDDDYKYDSSSSTDKYYVQLFAVSVAFNSETLVNSYSKVLDLGSITIAKP